MPCKKKKPNQILPGIFDMGPYLEAIGKGHLTPMEWLIQEELERPKSRYSFVFNYLDSEIDVDFKKLYIQVEALGRQLGKEILSSVTPAARSKLLNSMQVVVLNKNPEDDEQHSTLVIILPKDSPQPDLKLALESFKKGILKVAKNLIPKDVTFDDRSLRF